MKLTIRIINTIAILLTIFQILAHIGNVNSPPIKEKGVYAVLYYIGFNIFIIIAIILFIISVNFKKKLKRNDLNDMINSIGKKE